MSSLQMVEIFAGLDANHQPIAEKLPVRVNEDGSLQLVKSPVFLKGLASGDSIRYDHDKREVELLKRSGNLSIRVISRADIAAISDQLTPALEKLGGELDLENERMLVYSIHVSCGFKTIEQLLDQHVSNDTLWLYGNVYDPKDGTTPLNWWQEILQPE